MNEVSTRVFGVVLDGLASQGIDPARLVQGTDLSLDLLRDRKRRIDWPVFVALCNRMEQLVGGADALEKIGYEQLGTDSYAYMRSLAGLLAHPRDLYWIGTYWFGRDLFTVIEDDLETLADGRIREILRIPPEYAGCPALFHLIRGALRATPSLLGMDDAEVEAEITPHQATFLIKAPEPRRSLRTLWSSLVVSIRARPLFKQLRNQQVALQQANRALSRTVAALRESEERHRVLAELGADYGYCVRVSPNGDAKLEWVSGAIERLTGYADEQLAAIGWKSIVHPDDISRLLAELDGIAEQGPLQTEYRIVTRGGDVRWLHVSIRAEDAGESDGHRVFGAARDVTDRKLVQLENERLAQAVAQTEEGIAVLDRHGTLRYGNPAFSRLLGRDTHTLLGQRFESLPDRGLDDSVNEEIRLTLGQGRTYRGRHHQRRRDGSEFICDAVVTPVRDSTGRVDSFVGVLHDVTREVNLEEALLRAQRLDALGRLAGGLAHDFNNLLTVISGYSQMLEARMGQDSVAKEALEQIQEASERGSQLIRRLLTFSRSQASHPEPVDVNQAVEGVASVLQRVLGQEISVETDLTPGLDPIGADPSHIEHVLLNLALNARDAMPDGGNLRFHTRAVTLSPDDARAEGLAPGDYVAISVEDDGHGMDDGVRSRIFEPFFTTKEIGEGIGLGLSTTFGIVDQSGGAICVSSELGVGSTFTIFFPPLIEESADGSRSQTTSEAAEPSATILLVEKDGAVGRLARTALVDHGYAVIEATDCEAAIDAARRHEGPIDLLLSDLSIQKERDIDMAAQLSKQHPNLRVLYMADYPEIAGSEADSPERSLDGDAAPGRAWTLAKPFHTADLIARVRSALHGPST